MNNDYSNEINVKSIDFSLLSVGERFFATKQLAQDGKPFCIKTDTAKLANGAWTNAKNGVGVPSFVKYDTRVWIRKQ